MGRYLLLFCKIIVLVLLQVWVFSPLYVFQLATPFPYIYILFLIPINVSKMGITLWSALSGLLLDILSGTPGLHMAAFTATGFLRSYLLPLFVDADTDGSYPPSLAVSGWGIALLLLILTAFHHTLLFLLDAVGAFDLPYFLLRLGTSIVATYILTLVCLLLLGYRPRKRRD